MMLAQDTLTFTAGAAITKWRLLRLSGDRTVIHANPGQAALGAADATAASGDPVACHLLFGRLGSLELEAHEAITQNNPVFVGPDGRVAASGLGLPIGVALEAATAQGDVIEVLPYPDISVLFDMSSVIEINEDFIAYVPASSNEALWSNILTDSGTVTLADAKGGRIAIAASDGTIADNDEAYVYTTNEVFIVEAAKPIWFETRVKLAAADTDNANVMVGLLSGVAANALQDNGAGPPANYDGVVVNKVDGGSAWVAEASVGTTQTAIALTAPGAPGTSYQKIGILIVPTSSTSATAYIFIDGVLVGSQAFTFTGMTEMAAFVGVKNGGGTVNTTLHVDYIRVRQAR